MLNPGDEKLRRACSLPLGEGGMEEVFVSEMRRPAIMVGARLIEEVSLRPEKRETTFDKHTKEIGWSVII